MAEKVGQERDWKSEIESLRLQLEDVRRELERRYADLEAIYRVVKVIHYALDMEELSRTVKDVIENVLQIKSYSLMALDRGKREFVFQVAGNLSEETINRAVHEMEEQEPDWFERPHAAKPVIKLTTKEKEPLSMLCLPLHSQSKLIWALCASADIIGRLTKIDRDVVAIITTQIAIAIETAKLYSLTKELSIVDEASEVYNYRHFQRRLSLEAERARRFQRAFCLLLMDIDGFKNYIEKFGRERQDQALADIGRILKNHCRKVDTPARYELDEFVLVLPETEENGGRVVAEKIRRAVADYLFMGTEKREQRLTVSIGVACYPKHTTDPYRIVVKANEALAEAKREGKNRTYVLK